MTATLWLMVAVFAQMMQFRMFPAQPEKPVAAPEPGPAVTGGAHGS